MASRRIIVVRAAGVIDSIHSQINIFVSIYLLAAVSALDFAVAIGEDAALGRLVKALAVLEEGMGVGCEAGTRVVDDLMQGVAGRFKGAELLLTTCLADIFIRLNEVEVDLLRDYKDGLVGRNDSEEKKKKGKHTTSRAIILYAEILLQDGDIDEVALLEHGVTSRRRSVWVFERAIAQFSLVTWLRVDNIASLTFVGWGSAGVWEAIVGEFDALLCGAAHTGAAEGEDGQSERQEMVHFG